MKYWGRLLIFLLCTFPVTAEEPKIEISGALKWEQMELSANLALNLASAGIRLPAGRTEAEEIIKTGYVNLIRPYILSIPVDSSTTVGDLVDRGELSILEPEAIANSARRTSPVLSTDLLSLSGSYLIDLSVISSRLIRHNWPMEMRRILIPGPAAAHTGIIIVSSDELPIHGRNTAALLEPCLFPKIWDTEMNLIYERNILNPENTRKTLVQYVDESSIFQASPSGLSPEVTALVGNNPLKIIARGIFGARPTDPVIDKDDALLILSSETNRQLLRDGRVVIVLNQEKL
ncbi:MAG: polymerase, partial [Treponema sp.]|nr:polymerase [Treponema sp.]